MTAGQTQSRAFTKHIDMRRKPLINNNLLCAIDANIHAEYTHHQCARSLRGAQMESTDWRKMHDQIRVSLQASSRTQEGYTVMQKGRAPPCLTASHPSSGAVCTDSGFPMTTWSMCRGKTAISASESGFILSSPATHRCWRMSTPVQHPLLRNHTPLSLYLPLSLPLSPSL